MGNDLHSALCEPKAFVYVQGGWNAVTVLHGEKNAATSRGHAIGNDKAVYENKK